MKWGILTHSNADKVLMYSLPLKGTLVNCVTQIETAKWNRQRADGTERNVAQAGPGGRLHLKTHPSKNDK